MLNEQACRNSVWLGDFCGTPILNSTERCFELKKKYFPRSVNDQF